MENCALYARVSHKYNQEDNTSLGSQIKACRQYAQSQGWYVVTEKRETMSGAFVLARPRFNELLELASHNKITRIVVDIPDRLGRGDAIAQCEMLAKMQGCLVTYATRRFDDSTIEGFVQKSTEQLVSGIERINIARRTTKGRRALARDGRVIASGQRPYGYRFVSEYDDRHRKTDCTLEIVPDEAEIIKKVFQWLVYDQMTPYSIAKKLSEMQVPTLTDKDPRYKKKMGKAKWSRSTIHGFLKNETYTGIWHYGKYDIKRHDGVDGITRTLTKRDRDDPNRIGVQVPAIITRDLFDAAQRQLAENRRKGHKPTKHKYLLRGMMICARDNVTMAGQAGGGGGNTYYRCRHNFPDYHDVRCRAKMIRRDKADIMVWDYIQEVLLDKDSLLAGIEKRKEETQKARKVLASNLATLEALDQKDQQRLDALLDLYLDGKLKKDVYLAKKAKIEESIEDRQRNKVDLQTRLEEMGTFTDDDLAELEAMRKKLASKIDKATFEEKRHILKRLHVKCIWNDEAGELTVSGLFASKILYVNSSSQVQYTIPFAHTFQV